MYHLDTMKNKQANIKSPEDFKKNHQWLTYMNDLVNEHVKDAQSHMPYANDETKMSICKAIHKVAYHYGYLRGIANGVFGEDTRRVYCTRNAEPVVKAIEALMEAYAGGEDNA